MLSLNPRVNRQILDKSVRLIDENGVNTGIISTVDALQLAQDKGLDLIEVGPGVCKIGNYQKLLYQQKKAHKSKPAPSLKEFQFGVNIAPHDLQVKANKINDLLEKNHPIRLVVRFYGRENAKPEKGHELIEKISSLLQGAIVDPPKQEGTMLIAMARKEKNN